MSATPQLFTPLHIPAGSPPETAVRPVWSALRTALAGFMDKLAPEGYEDDTGFHVQAAFEPAKQELRDAPSSLGEHI